MKKLITLLILLSFTIKAQEIKIGTQTWSTKNLDVTTYRNGDAIPQVQDKNSWENLTTGAWCYYKNNSANGIKYGKLYNWYAVNDPRGLAPKGYHIPEDEEWTILEDYLRTTSFIPGEKMKSTSGWDSYSSGGFSKEVTCPNCANWNSEYHSKVACTTCQDTKYVSVYKSMKTHSGNGTNTSGFAGLPGGFRAGADVYTTNGWVEQLVTPAGSFDGISFSGCWWSSSEVNTNDAWYRKLSNSLGYVYRNGDDKHNGFSVRCLRGESNNSFQGDQSNSLFEVTIGNQIWTSKNLDVSTYRNGDAIPQVQDAAKWTNLTTGAWCYYENESAYGKKYGKLYNWYAVNDPRGLAPEGYHIPTDAESKTLIYYLGEKSSTKMKIIRGGYRATDGNYNYLGERGYWWSSSLENGYQARCRILNKIEDKPWSYYYPMRYGFSVLCLRDGISGEDDKKNVNKPFVPVRDGKTETKPVIQKKPVTPPTPTKIEPETFDTGDY